MNRHEPVIRRGSPLALLAIVMVVWIGARAMTWQNPFPVLEGIPGVNLLIADRSSSENSGALEKTAISAASNGTQAYLQRVPVPDTGLTMVGGTGSKPAHNSYNRAANAFAHQLLWLEALGAKLPFDEVRVHASAGPARLAGVTPISPPVERYTSPGRWSFDAWGFWKQGSGSAVFSEGRVPIYGASQVGANLQYRLAPKSRHDPRVYARAYRAIVANGESEVAFGGSGRPIGALPIRIAGELRVTENRGRTNLRPAVIAATELPPQKLFAGLRLEAFGGAGYVGGAGATPFVDGQAAVTSQLTEFEGPIAGRARLSVGAGAWGGAQENASRIDVGPTMRLDLTLGKVPARLSVDWRERVGGDASPDSGLAATLSTRF